MKNVILAFICVSGVLSASELLSLQISGMSCGGCASGINESFAEDFPNYKSHVDYKSKTMTIKSKDGSDIDEKKVKEALEEMGFSSKETKLHH